MGRVQEKVDVKRYETLRLSKYSNYSKYIYAIHCDSPKRPFDSNVEVCLSVQKYRVFCSKNNLVQTIITCWLFV